jgi:hypothetical protein
MIRTAFVAIGALALSRIFLSSGWASFRVIGMRMVQATAHNHVSREHHSDKYAKKTDHKLPRLHLHNRRYNPNIFTQMRQSHLAAG